MLAIYAALLLLGLCRAQEIGPPAFSPEPPSESLSAKPFGAYYCQARCLASCLDTFLAPSLEECEKFCPPFQDSMPCPADNAQCWQTCGVPALPNDPPPPASPDLTPAILGSDQEFDPFLIELTWSAVPNASLYIVEFFPQNRDPKPGESNFFQVMTTSLTYKVRKDDECIDYMGRVIAVNSYGISEPTSAFISAPLPAVTPENTQFSIRNMRPDPLNPGMVTVTIDYTLPSKWPLDDIDIDRIHVSSLDCKGPLGDKSFGSLAAPGGASNPSYTAIIGKSPTTAIQLSFFDDMMKSDCFIQMRLGSISTRCNTSIDYEDDLAHAPGVDFRINCDTIPEACTSDNDDPPTEIVPLIPIPASIAVDPEVVVPPLNPPGHMPPGVDRPDDTLNITDEVPMNAPNVWPLFVIGQGNQDPNVQQPMPPGRVNIIDVGPNGTDALTMAVIPDGVAPAMCDLEMLEVQPIPNILSGSLIDLNVQWLERQTLPPSPPASYFIIRYGPIIRRLVDDERQPNEIIPGYETVVRTGQTVSEMPFLPDPIREINITGIQRSSLLKIQICAIYDPSSEALIQWDNVRSRKIDLAALEPFLDFEAPVAPVAPFGMIPPDMSPMDMSRMDMNPMDMGPVDMGPVDQSAIDFVPVGSMMGPDMSNMDPDMMAIDPSMEPVDVPLVVSVNVEQKSSPMAYWMTVSVGMLLLVLTLMLIFIFLRRMCMSRRHFKQMHCEKPMVIVTTPTPKPVINDMVKVPLP